jgi:hypothetical protein
MDSSSSAQQPLMDGWSNIASLDQQQLHTKQKANEEKEIVVYKHFLFGLPMALASRVIPSVEGPVDGFSRELVAHSPIIVFMQQLQKGKKNKRSVNHTDNINTNTVKHG